MSKEPAIIPVHELENPEADYQNFEMFPLLVKKEKSMTEPHRHDYYELFIFINGGGIHLIDFRELDIHACSAQLVAPGQVHHLRRSNESVGYALLFKENFLRGNTENMQFISRFAYMEMEACSPVFQFSKQDFQEVMALIGLIEKETNRSDELNYKIISQFLNALILQCRRGQSQNQITALSTEQQLYAEFRKQVNTHYRECKKVKDYAAMLNTTEGHLNDVSKRGSGKSASTIIYERIIVEAKRLIANTEMTVKEICFDLNYEDQGHFSKFFKKQCGHSPSVFRELYK